MKELMQYMKPTTLAAIAADLAEWHEVASKTETAESLLNEAEMIIEQCFDIERGNNGAASFLQSVMKQ